MRMLILIQRRKSLPVATIVGYRSPPPTATRRPLVAVVETFRIGEARRSEDLSRASCRLHLQS
jgi:hypothetical protein